MLSPLRASLLSAQGIGEARLRVLRQGGLAEELQRWETGLGEVRDGSFGFSEAGKEKLKALAARTDLALPDRTVPAATQAVNGSPRINAPIRMVDSGPTMPTWAENYNEMPRVN